VGGGSPIVGKGYGVSPGGVGPLGGRAVVGVGWGGLVGTVVGGAGVTVGTGVGVGVEVAAG